MTTTVRRSIERRTIPLPQALNKDKPTKATIKDMPGVPVAISAGGAGGKGIGLSCGLFDGIQVFISEIISTLRSFCSAQKTQSSQNASQVQIPSSQKKSGLKLKAVAAKIFANSKLLRADSTALESLESGSGQKAAIKGAKDLSRFIKETKPEIVAKFKLEAQQKCVNGHSTLTIDEMVEKRIFKLALKTHLMLLHRVASFDRNEAYKKIETQTPEGKVLPWQKLFNAPVYAKKNANGAVQYYVEEKKLGAGASNSAYSVLDLSQKERVVYRRFNHGDRPWELQAWRREITLHRQLNDSLGEGVPQLREIVDGEKEHGVILEYCEGGDIWSANGKLDGSARKDILLDVSDALCGLHQRGLVHKDLKTSNVFIKDGRGKLADFGAMFEARNGCPFGGNYIYNPPELFGPNYYQGGVEIDSWQFGMMAFEMKYGFLPTFTHYCASLPPCRDDYTYRTQYLPNFVAGLQEMKKVMDPKDPYDQLIMGCLKINPNERLTAQQIHEQLGSMDAKSFESPTFLETLKTSQFLDENMDVEQAYTFLDSIKDRIPEGQSAAVLVRHDNGYAWVYTDLNDMGKKVVRATRCSIDESGVQPGIIFPDKAKWNMYALGTTWLPAQRFYCNEHFFQQLGFFKECSTSRDADRADYEVLKAWRERETTSPPGMLLRHADNSVEFVYANSQGCYRIRGRIEADAYGEKIVDYRTGKEISLSTIFKRFSLL